MAELLALAPFRRFLFRSIQMAGILTPQPMAPMGATSTLLRGVGRWGSTYFAKLTLGNQLPRAPLIRS